MKRVRLTGHGFSLYLNLAAGILVVMFAMAVADKLAARSLVLGIPVRHFITAVVIMAVALLLGILAFRKNARFNRRVFGLILLSAFALEASMKLLDPVANHHADIYRAPAPYVMFTGQPGATARNTRGYACADRGGPPTRTTWSLLKHTTSRRRPLAA